MLTCFGWPPCCSSCSAGSTGSASTRWSCRATVRALPGAGYTDMHAQLPWQRVLMVVNLLGAALLAVAALRRSWSLPAIVLVAVVVAEFVNPSILPSAVQRFIVEPQTLSRERPYLTDSLRFTRIAYGLEGVAEHPVSADATISSEELRSNRERASEHPALGQRGPQAGDRPAAVHRVVLQLPRRDGRPLSPGSEDPNHHRRAARAGPGPPGALRPHMGERPACLHPRLRAGRGPRGRSRRGGQADVRDVGVRSGPRADQGAPATDLLRRPGARCPALGRRAEQARRDREAASRRRVRSRLPLRRPGRDPVVRRVPPRPVRVEVRGSELGALPDAGERVAHHPAPGRSGPPPRPVAVPALGGAVPRSPSWTDASCSSPTATRRPTRFPTRRRSRSRARSSTTCASRWLASWTPSAGASRCTRRRETTRSWTHGAPRFPPCSRRCRGCRRACARTSATRRSCSRPRRGSGPPTTAAT